MEFVKDLVAFLTPFAEFLQAFSSSVWAPLECNLARRAEPNALGRGLLRFGEAQTGVAGWIFESSSGFVRLSGLSLALLRLTSPRRFGAYFLRGGAAPLNKFLVSSIRQP